MEQKGKAGFTRKKKGKSRFLWGIAAFSLLGIGILLVGISYTPKKYNPKQPIDPEVVSPYLTHKLGPDFYNNVQLDRPFELIVDQAGLNDILSRHPWPMDFDGISFSMPTLIFTEQSLTLMTSIDVKGFSTVLSIYALPVLSDQGTLNMNIQTVSLGAIPITPIAKMIAEKIASQSFDSSNSSDDLTEQIIKALISNNEFKPVFTCDDHAVRVVELELQAGQAHLKLEPVVAGQP